VAEVVKPNSSAARIRGGGFLDAKRNSLWIPRFGIIFRGSLFYFHRFVERFGELTNWTLRDFSQKSANFCNPNPYK
jgi:hypothetical protein